MANLADKYDEENSLQLADAEISRILSTLQKGEFKRSETGNARPDQTFNPRSLMEIAETARHEEEVAKAIAPIAEVADHQGTHEVKTAVDTPGDHEAPEITKEDQVHSKQTAGVLDNKLQDTSLEMPTKEINTPDLQDTPVTDASMGLDAEVNSGAENVADLASPTSPFETAQTAYDRGHADGVVSGREMAESELRETIGAEFEAKLSDKISAFETALIGLIKPKTVDTEALSRSIRAAIIRLSAARIGAAIDEMPELMVARIESLADAAGKNVASGQVFMHPDDCAVIAPVLAARQDPVMIKADPELQRGDIRIRFNGIDISDVADLRADWQIKNQILYEDSVNAKPNMTEKSEAESEIQSSENLSEDSQVASAQSNKAHSLQIDGDDDKSLEGSTERSEDNSKAGSIGLMPLTTTGGEDLAPDEGAEKSDDKSEPEPIALMPLTTTGGENPAPDEGAEKSEDNSESEPIGLMPLTTTGGEDLAPDEGAEKSDDKSEPEPIALMPLTTTGGENPAPDEGAEKSEDNSESGPIALMPLTTTSSEDPEPDEISEKSEDNSNL